MQAVVSNLDSVIFVAPLIAIFLAGLFQANKRMTPVAIRRRRSVLEARTQRVYLDPDGRSYRRDRSWR
jgi:hypothetical protein